MSSSDSRPPQCANCQNTSSPIWRRGEEDVVLCLECHTSLKKVENEKSVAESVNQGMKKKKNGKRNKIDRGGRSSNSPLAGSNARNTFRGRRSFCKEMPIKSPVPETEVVTTNSVFYKGLAYEVGDVVSILDFSGGIYYAIIRGFLVDQYSDKYAVLTWVLPKTPDPVEFDPLNFILGPEEEEPRSLETLQFVCHSPRSSSFSLSSQYDLDLLNLWMSPSTSARMQQ